MSDRTTARDQATAAAFATSWNNVGEGSVYTREQFLDWMAPLAPSDLAGRAVLELGFGNGSLLYHTARCGPRRLVGVELGDTLEQTRRNLDEVLRGAPELELELVQGDLTQVALGTFDVVYCIGVLHHLKEPAAGLRAVLRHVRPGGRFHCWVYAHEGNAVVRHLVEPIRRVASRLPWWLTKYGLALPLVLPYYGYAKALRALADRGVPGTGHLPLGAYSRWIAQRPLWFFHHVAFDQLVTPQTAYIDRATIERWLQDPDVEPGSGYTLLRNGNSWKFGGRKAAKRGGPPSDDVAGPARS